MSEKGTKGKDNPPKSNNDNPYPLKPNGEAYITKGSTKKIHKG